MSLPCALLLALSACGVGGSGSLPEAPAAGSPPPALSDNRGGTSLPDGVQPPPSGQAPMPTSPSGPGSGSGSGSGSHPSPTDNTPPSNSPPVNDEEPTGPVTSGPATKAVLKASTRNYPNHDGGIVGWAGDLGDLWEQGMVDEIALGYPLMRAQMSLEDFIGRDLTSTYLSRLDSGFAAVRRAGGKVILRFYYTAPHWSFSSGTVPDASITQVQRHIAQLGPVLQKNSDVIASVEAGFIGAWGEWHSSGSGLTSTTNKELIKNALLSAVPSNRQVLFRYTSDLSRWYPTPVGPGDKGTAKARSGMHNDCILSTPHDGGTFPTEASREYVRKMTAHVIYGGETCALTPQRLSCADILKEGREFHMNYLNRFGTLSQFRESWKAGGCESEVLNSVGVRMHLVEVEHSTSAPLGGKANFTVRLRNTGWSRLHDGKRIKLVFVRTDGAGSAVIDAATIEPGSIAPKLASDTPDRLSFTVQLPADMAVGDWKVGVSLRDAADSLQNDVRYALRFANSDDTAAGQRWDAAYGAFFTGTILSVH